MCSHEGEVPSKTLRLPYQKGNIIQRVDISKNILVEKGVYMATKHTPMMEQYLAIKADYQDAFLFYRLGDFYELFFQDAVEASRLLEITLTSRNKNAADPIPMCGVPYHSAQDYIRKLIETGHKVAICEQVEDPKFTKGMVKREVVQVITPGTYFNENGLNSKENQYIATIHQRGPAYYLAYVDVTTGEIFITSTSDIEGMINELLNIEVKEIVLPSDFDEAISHLLKSRLQTFFSTFTMGQGIQRRWQLEDANEGESQALDFCLAYIESVQKQVNQFLQPVERYQVSHYLRMNAFTKQQLELTKSIRTHRKKGSLHWLLDKTKTAMGGRLLQKWLDQPLIHKENLSLRHDKVDCLLNHYFDRVEILGLLDHIYDLERLVTKIAMGSAGPRDLDHIRQSITYFPTINQILSNLDPKRHLFTPLEEFSDLYTLIDRYLETSLPLTFAEGNIIKSGVDEELDHYRDALTNGNQWLVDLQAREREITGIKNLKVGYNKVFGYYIEMSRLQSASLDDARYEVKQTLANHQRFFTPELKELEATILSAKERVHSIEYQRFVDLRNQVMPYIPSLQETAQELAQLDVLINFARLSEEENYVRPVISDQVGDFEILEGRHPVLEKLIGVQNFVANDVTIDEKKPILLLTGPNMSGKSTYMRQVAYCIILNQIGCFVPAKFARLSIVDKIFTRIGSSDDLSLGQSTFMVEMMETQVALSQATPRSLLLFDELGRGTATYDGMALAYAILHYVYEKVHAAIIFSTHYHELTQLDKQISGLRNIHVGAIEQEGELVFLHKILEGPADKSYGIHVAQLAGLPQDLIENANRMLAQLEGEGKTISVLEEDSPIKEKPAKDTKASINQDYQVEAYLTTQLKEMDLNQMTPIEAFNRLIELKDFIHKGH